MLLNEKQNELCTNNQTDYSGLKALFLNCTLKKSGELSHTEGLIQNSAEIMQKNGIETEIIRPVDFDIAFGVYPDMTEHGWKIDDWQIIYKKVLEADILCLVLLFGLVINLPYARS